MVIEVHLLYQWTILSASSK